MMRIALIGIGAGAAAALLFASVASGTLLSIPLFYLAPLPILIAALGWSHWAALIAVFCAALALAAAFGAFFSFAFLAGAGAPGWWLGYLAMLARPVAGANGHSETLEWYPPGRLVIWAAVLAAMMVILAIPVLGSDAQSFRANLHGALLQLLQSEDVGTASDPAKLGRVVDFLVAIVPPVAALVATITSLINLWLAARIVKISGLLRRPWPQLPAMSFPRPIAALLAAAVVIGFLGGLIGIAAGVLAASLLMAYAVLGLAVMHAITQGMASRSFLLGGVYAAIIVLGWPVLALCLLGLIETAFDLRARVLARQGPPART